MCEANAYLIDDGGEELILESVDLIEPLGRDHWRLVSIFGEQKTVRGRINHMALMEHRIFFDPTESE